MKPVKLFSLYSGILILLISSFLIGIFLWHLKSITKLQIFNQLENVVEVKAEHVKYFLEEQKQKTVLVAQFPNIKAFLSDISNQKSLSQVKLILQNIKENISHFDELFILDPLGNILINTQEGDTPPDIFKKFDFSQEQNNQAYIHHLRYCYCVNKYVLDISTPIFNEEDKIIGVVIARLYLKNLGEIIKEPIQMQGLGQIYLVNQDSILITPSPFLAGENQGVFTQKVDNKNFQNCLEDTLSGGYQGHDILSNYLDFRGEEVLGAHKKISETNWCLLAEVDQNKVIQKIQKRYLSQSIAISLVLIILLIVISWAYSSYRAKKNYKTKN